MTTPDAPEPLPHLVLRAVFGVFVGFVTVGTVQRFADRPALAVAAAVAAILLFALAVFGRRRWVPPSVVAASVAVVTIAHGQPANIAWFAIVIAAGWSVYAASPLATAGFTVAAVALFAVQLAIAPDPGWVSWIGGTLFTVAGSLLGRRQRALVAALRAAQRGLAQRAQAEERNRIARELHDVIAHSLTVSLLHVSSARLALRDDPQDAARALEEAERLGRASLDEVRHAVGLLHRSGSPDPTTPLPGSVDVPALIDRVRAAGADVHARVEGELASLPVTVGLATYRIVQEALTNVLKHAPGTRATVLVAVTDTVVRVDVDSAGAPAGRSGQGRGIEGMRERAASVGGTCEAGPGGPGWRVSAALPLGARPVP